MIKEIRQELGLSQEMVAGYLRISRSQLAMVESKRRELNSPAFIQLLSLYNQFISKDSKKVTRVPGTDKTIQKNLLQSIDRHITQKEYSLSTARKRFKKLEQQNKRATEILLQLSSVKSEASVKDKLLIGIIESNAQKLLTDSSVDNQLKLQMKIQGLSAELRFLTDRKAKLKS